MRLEPLSQFVCDNCGDVIETPGEGWLEWLVGPAPERTRHNFRIVHLGPASPLWNGRRGCHYGEDQLVGDMPLEHYLGPDGLVKLLVMFEQPLEDKQELIDIVRRLHVPHYEEARLYWSSARADGFFQGMNEYAPYLQDTLARVIEKYGDGSW